MVPLLDDVSLYVVVFVTDNLISSRPYSLYLDQSLNQKEHISKILTRKDLFPEIIYRFSPPSLSCFTSRAHSDFEQPSNQETMVGFDSGSVNLPVLFQLFYSGVLL